MRVAVSVNRFLERMGYQVVRTDTLNQMTNQLNVAMAALAERQPVIDAVREASEAVMARRLDLGGAAATLMKDIRLAAQITAAQSAAQWIYRHAERVPQYATRVEMLEAICSGTLISGDLAEFGVFTGAVTRFLRPRFPDRAYHAFDSFRGVPEQMALSVAKNAFDQGGVVPDLPEGVTIHAGWFEDTVPIYRQHYSGVLALVYIDCDLYESVCTVLDGVADQLRPGSIVAFDDWYNFPNWEAHSYRALNEFVARTGLSFEPIGVTTTEHSVAFRVQ
jgi:hypothetical protein